MSEQHPTGETMGHDAHDDRPPETEVDPAEYDKALAEQNEGDPHHPVPTSQPGGGGAPGGVPPDEEV